MTRNRIAVAVLAALALVLLGWSLISRGHHKSPEPTQQPVSAGTLPASTTATSAPSTAPLAPSATMSASPSDAATSADDDEDTSASPMPTPDNAAAIMAPAVTYATIQGSFDYTMAYPGYDTKKLVGVTSGDLHKKVATQVDPANTSGGDQRSYQQMKSMGMAMKNVIEGTPQVVANASQPNTWTVSMHVHTTTFTGQQHTDGNDGPSRFVVITVAKVGNDYRAVSDEMPQAP